MTFSSCSTNNSERQLANDKRQKFCLKKIRCQLIILFVRQLVVSVVLTFETHQEIRAYSYSLVISLQIFLHTDTNDLYKYVPKEMLPSEYGGNAGSMNDLHSKFIYFE